MSKRTKVDPEAGLAIRHCRRISGLSLDKVAAATGISKAHLCEIERLRTNPSYYIVRDIAKVVGFFMSDIYDHAEEERAALQAAKGGEDVG